MLPKNSGISKIDFYTDTYSFYDRFKMNLSQSILDNFHKLLFKQILIRAFFHIQNFDRSRGRGRFCNSSIFTKDSKIGLHNVQNKLKSRKGLQE